MIRQEILEKEVLRVQDRRQTLGRLAGYFGAYRRTVLFIAALLVISTIFQVVTPYLIGQAIDCFIAPRFETDTAACVLADASTKANLGALAVVMAVLVVFNIAAALATGYLFYLIAYVGQAVLVRLREEVMAQIHRLSLGYYNRHSAGDIMSRLTNDADQIAVAVNGSLVRVGTHGLVLLGTCAMMLWMHPPLALMTLAVVPLMVGATVVFARMARSAFRKTRAEMGEVNSELQESIAGVREVQAFSREAENIERFREINAANRDANVRAMAITSSIAPVLNLLSAIGQALILGVGGIWAIRGTAVLGYPVTIGVIVAFLVFMLNIYEPVRVIGQLWAQLQSALAGAERIFQLLDVAPELEDAPDAGVLPSVQGRIVFEDVHFGYNANELVLKGISGVLEAGQRVAIVGPTGAGKSSLVNLVARFYEPSSGKILLDGYDIKSVTQASLRQQVAMVLQDNFLWSDTILNNIRYGNLAASEAELVEAAKLAHAHDFIQQLPDGYQTMLGERGIGLSAGQRQLIAIARAALSSAHVLILDEATSNIDTRTERLIQKALEALMEKRSSLVIAHRLSTIRDADAVWVMEGGRIVERGTHQELMALEGAYHRLYMSQFSYERETKAGQTVG